MLDFGFYQMDCMDGMREFPDKYFDLAVVDPPYGISINHNMGRRSGDKPSDYKRVTWDGKPPDDKYFQELFRVSKRAVIWGAIITVCRRQNASLFGASRKSAKMFLSP